MISTFKFLLISIFLFYTINGSCAIDNYTYSDDSLLIIKINIEGNDLTKEKIIIRELIFNEGDYILLSELSDLIGKSEKNLLNTSLFNFATINYEINEGNDVIVSIIVQERWYIWPYPILEHADRNFSSFIKNREWYRVDYGLYLLINNFRGRKEVLKFKTIFGYNNSFVIHYRKPFIDKKQRLGLGFEWNYFRNHELPFRVSNDKLDYLKLYDSYAGENLNFSTFLIYRPFIYTRHFLNIKFTKASVADSLYSLNSSYFINDKKEISYISLDYVFDYDKRDSKVYPLEGYRFFALINKTGVGIFTQQGVFYLRSILEDNLRLTDKLYLNTGLEGKWGFGDENSIYFNEAIGYENYIRGLEYYTTNGSAYYMSKTNLKYELISQSAINFKFIPTNKFSKAHYALYVNLFFDTGYVKSEMIMNNDLVNEFIFGGGIGIDLVTYYDKVLRVEYSMNKFGEHGIFLHLGAPIIKD